MSTIGNRIREKRIQMGLSVDELAEKLGKNRATVYRYESNEIENFPISIIGPLAQVLRTSPAYLMGWEEIKKPATAEDDGLTAVKLAFIERMKDLSDSDIDVLQAAADALIARREK